MSTLYKVQVGAFKEKKNAQILVDKLKKAGFKAVIIKESSTGLIGSTPAKSKSGNTKPSITGL